MLNFFVCLIQNTTFWFVLIEWYWTTLSSPGNILSAGDLAEGYRWATYKSYNYNTRNGQISLIFYTKSICLWKMLVLEFWYSIEADRRMSPQDIKLNVEFFIWGLPYHFIIGDYSTEPRNLRNGYYHCPSWFKPVQFIMQIHGTGYMTLLIIRSIS